MQLEMNRSTVFEKDLFEQLKTQGWESRKQDTYACYPFYVLVCDHEVTLSTCLSV